ncbi:breast carcinoma-amplified sequence 3 isoform X1, partial [Tachysurus ichikawai]
LAKLIKAAQFRVVSDCEVFVTVAKPTPCVMALKDWRKVLFAGGDNEQIVHGELNGCWSGEVSGAMTCRGDLTGEAQELFSVRHGPVRAARILPAPQISEYFPFHISV